MALSITTANYQEIIDSGKPVVIDFWAEWCGPCRMVGPIIDELAAEYDGKVVIGKCDLEIERPADLSKAHRQHCKITSWSDNRFGGLPHWRIGGE